MHRYINFNPRSHERSDECVSIEGYCEEISIHAPTRGATLLSFSKFDRASISIHAPTRGATCIKKKGTSHKFNFNPRSHERSDNVQYFIAPADGISIHAPTRGATLSTVIVLNISEFQSTLPREERHFSKREAEEVLNISIHAPTRGATTTPFNSAGGY